MAHPPCGNSLGVDQDPVTAGEPGIAAVVAMLQGERGLPFDGCHGVDQVARASTLDFHPTHVAQSAAGEPGIAAVVAMLQGERSVPRDGCDGVDQVASASTLHFHPTRVAQSATKIGQTHVPGTPEVGSCRDPKRNVACERGGLPAETTQDYDSRSIAACRHRPERTSGGASLACFALRREHPFHATPNDLSQVSLRCNVDVQSQYIGSRGRAIGDAIAAELDLEDLQSKRRRLVDLSRDVLEARCPGSSGRVTMSDNDYLREASCALADISNDVDEAARKIETVRASFIAMTNADVRDRCNGQLTSRLL